MNGSNTRLRLAKFPEAIIAAASTAHAIAPQTFRFASVYNSELWTEHGSKGAQS
jgi:hypothetical protein